MACVLFISIFLNFHSYEFVSLLSFSFFLLSFLKLINLILTVLGLHCCVDFSRCSKRGLLCSCRARAPHCSGFPCCRAQALGCKSFSTCGMWAQQLKFPGSSAQAQQLWGTGLVGLWHVGSSWTRDRTCVSYIGRWIPYHWATREDFIIAFQLIHIVAWESDLYLSRLMW